MNERCYRAGSSGAGCTEAVVAPSAWENAMPGRELVDGQFPRLQHRITHLELAGALP